MNRYVDLGEVEIAAVVEVGEGYFSRRRLSGAMELVLREAGIAASHDLNLLISGPSGSGKDYVARLVQASSKQADKPFVVVSCAALPGDLLEAELFGVSRGAFSGAVARPGMVEMAKGGYLLLDEIAELPLDLQPKLLEFLESKEFSRLGEKKKRKAVVRVVAASSKNLAKLVDEGLFRADLFYRLAQAELHLPALVERQEEILDLLSLFIEQANEELEVDIEGFNSRVAEEALAYAWPGNVRELQNKVRLAVLRQRSGELESLLG